MLVVLKIEIFINERFRAKMDILTIFNCTFIGKLGLVRTQFLDLTSCSVSFLSPAHKRKTKPTKNKEVDRRKTGTFRAHIQFSLHFPRISEVKLIP